MASLEPSFRRGYDGSLLLTDSGEVSVIKKEHREKDLSRTRPAFILKNEAKERVKKAGGDTENPKHVLGCCELQFGCLRGMTFKWILENSPGYAGYLVAAMEKEKNEPLNHRWVNKMAFKKYVELFPEGKKLIEMKKQERARKGVSHVPQTEIPEMSDYDLLVATEEMELLSAIEKSTELTDEELILATQQVGMEMSKEEEEDVRSAQSADVQFEPVRDIFKPMVSSDVSRHRSPQTTHQSPEPSTSFVQPSMVSAGHAVFQAGTKSTDRQKPSTGRAVLQATTKSTTVTPEKPLPVALSDKTTSASAGAGQQESLELQVQSEPSALDQLLQPNPDTSEELLYRKWRDTLPAVDHQWISATFFRRKGNKPEFCIEKASQLWHYPPQPSMSPNNINRMDRYFAHKLFLWMPLNIWSVLLQCPHKDPDTDIRCGGSMVTSGIHQKTRMVLDIDSYYIMATEYLRCSTCSRKIPAWAHNIINQLDQDKQLLFPCILTTQYACDLKVIQILRNRGLGNSSSMVRSQLEESHGEQHLKAVHHYASNLKGLKTSVGQFVSTSSVKEPPAITPVPGHKWLMKVYQLDVLHRIDFIKAAITSKFGNVLKMDSTKKITRKLAGKSAKTAMWATNVGNEYGQVIMSVLTTNEGQGLSKMISGICRRYQLAGVPAPRLLYVDRDCCGGSQVGKYFDWPYLIVRLDVWHFMRRLAIGCNSDAHPLYGDFMAGLSQCIFKWEEEDVNLLKKAKRAELLQQNVPNPSESDVMRAIKKNELALHCRRMTRGARETITLIDKLIESMTDDKGLDILGVPLFDGAKMKEIWSKQSHHVACLQDPADVQLYTKIRTQMKGGIELPVYRCARGSTSLESFHLHMNRFIPGTLASDVNFQVYLLDGLHRWNENRSWEAIEGTQNKGPLSYDGVLRHSVNALTQDLFKKDMCTGFKLPSKYTGELIGLEYLYSQSSAVQKVAYEETARSMENDIEEDTGEEEAADEGFEEPESVSDLTIPSIQPKNKQLVHDTSEDPNEPAESSTTEEGVDDNENVIEEGEEEFDESDIGPDNKPGYLAVVRLARYLVGLKDNANPTLTSNQASELIKHWNMLRDCDKERSRFPPHYKQPSPSSRYRARKKQVAPGVQALEKATLGPNATRSSDPTCNRYVGAVVDELIAAYPSDQRRKTAKGEKTSTSRWNLITTAYGRIQGLVLSSRRVMEQTDIQLPSLNVHTIQTWYNTKGKERDLKIVRQGIQPLQAPMTGSGAPKPLTKPSSLQVGSTDAFTFFLPPDTSGMAKLKGKKHPRHTVSSTATSGEIPTTSLRPILPKSTPSLLLVESASGTPLPTVVIQEAAASVPPSAPTGQPAGFETIKTIEKAAKRTSAGNDGTPTPKKIFKCKKCGQPRVQPNHRQYMFFWWCGITDSQSFEDFRVELVRRGVARKHKRLPDST